jgi:ABC-type multidrug transport system permease subunit
MDTKLETVFKKIGDLKSPDFLQSKIIFRINQIQTKRSKLQMIITRTIGGLSFVAFFPILINFISQLQNSGFWNYLSLFFTDTGIVALYWKQFSLSLIEATPMLSLTLILLSLLGLFTSFKFGFIKKDIKRIGLSANCA